ncbi:DUF4476 domain-containing protein [Hyalangium sp.]|uniref:DUF4476 domain-containing protein n=1 Tax=Hyalangium sp. TaxID=2028555 RepID=UPI002D5FA96E|nr:DUF4476 domain-containing protein [Hyalangium sp.]HYI01589.1 DUF4476 domain-containing protein [Hyalangium sp.]
MRALVLSVAVLMSVVASAQTAQGMARPPPPGQPTGPINTRPGPPTPIPGYNDSGSWYDDYDIPEGFRRRGTLVVIEREEQIDRMARMEVLLAQATREGNNRRGREALSKLREEMNAMRHDLNKAPDLRSFRQRQSPRPQPPPPPPQPQVYPISEDQLQSLIRAVNKESFGDGKLRVLEAAASSQHFLVPQVTKILQRFSFGEDKLDAVRVLWPRVLDRENSFQLYQLFSFQNEKDQLKQIIGR